MAGLSAGILVYLFFDVMHEAVELTGARDILSWAIFLASLCVGFVGLVAFEQQGKRLAGGAGAPLFLPYTIAVGMGLHNLGEGLAIGASYAQGQWALSGLLVGGFALHNGTEGLGLMGPGPDSHPPARQSPVEAAPQRPDLRERINDSRPTALTS
jgi:ZIP family zinc transporter